MHKTIIDFGSRSIKVYRATPNQGVILIETINWCPLERSVEISGTSPLLLSALDRLSVSLQNKLGKKYGIGTAFARRNPSLARLTGEFCEAHDIVYETISQQKEVALIKAAFSGSANELDVFNVGGGSIQICRADQTNVLLDFGISDLNKIFSLNGEPGVRRISDCVEWVSRQLPSSCTSFVYSGGELTYLKALGVPVSSTGRCLLSDFERFSSRLARLPLSELSALSPFGDGWMTGAVASNCIVLSALSAASAAFFYASDLNVANGLVKLFAEQLPCYDNTDI